MTDPTVVLERALDWLHTHLAWFGPQTWSTELPALETPSQTVIELLLLCRVLDRGPYAGRAQSLADGARALARDHVRSPEFSAALGRPDAGFGYLVWVLGLLGPDPDPLVARARAQAERVVRSYEGQLPSLVWPVVNRVELDYVCWLTGLPTPAGGYAELRGVDGYRHRDALLIDEGEAYGITHEVLYATDLGGRPLPGGPTAAAEVVPLVEILLAAALVDDQLDLAAELVHCLLVLDEKAPAHPLVAAGWERFARAQHASGLVPGPPYRPEIVEQADRPAKRTALIFRTCYHTTLVVAMAVAARLATRHGASRVTSSVRDPLAPGRLVVAARERRLEEAALLALDLPAGRVAGRLRTSLVRQLRADGCPGIAGERLLRTVERET